VVPVFEGDFGNGLGLRDASVVDENFDFAKLPFGFGDEAFCISGNGNVGLNGNGFAAERFACFANQRSNGGADLFGSGNLLMIVDGNMAAGVCERQRNGFADPPAGARDKSNSILKRGPSSKQKRPRARRGAVTKD
jgi:ABC-type glycerol-3-phosphate transport system substrate-binding protein